MLGVCFTAVVVAKYRLGRYIDDSSSPMHSGDEQEPSSEFQSFIQAQGRVEPMETHPQDHEVLVSGAADDRRSENESPGGAVDSLVPSGLGTKGSYGGDDPPKPGDEDASSHGG